MKIFSKISVLAFAALGLSSCLEDPNIEDQKYGMINLDANKIIELPNPLQSHALPLDNKEVTVDFLTVHLAANQVAAEDIKVTLTMDGSKPSIDAYNEEHDTEYVGFPQNLYSFPNGLVVTIPKGSRDGVLQIKTNASKYDPASTYALKFAIANVDKPGYIVSGNFQNSVVAISAKNKYDGNYEVVATAPMVDRVSSALSGYYPLDADLRTTGGNTVKMYTHTYLGGYEGHPIKSGASSSYYGNFGPVFTMDDAGNVTAVTNFWGQGTNSSGRAARLNPDGKNKFTVNADGSKVLEVSYIMVQNGVDRTFFHEKWTFKKDR